MPHAQVIAIGDELILGRTVDTNSAWIAQRLTACGLQPSGICSIGDDEDGIVRAIRAAARRSPLVICTGGLGPTDDDRTRHALARAAGVGLEARPAAWRHIVRWYAEHRHGVVVPERNRRQTMFPVGSLMLANDRGTAPGLLCRVGTAWVACLPGVPHEMRAMFDRLARRLPRLVPGLARPSVGEVWFAGIGESQAQEMLGDLLTPAEPMVGITVSELGHITLRAVGTARAVRERTSRLAEAIAPWRLPEPGLAPSLVAALTSQGGTIACAESCTAGHAVAQLAAVPGASSVLRESLVAYHPRVKQTRLGVPARLIARHGVVSEAVARAMAEGMRRTAQATLAVATTGIAGPSGGTVETPVGSVWIAVAMAGFTEARLVRIGGSRERIQQRAASEALLLAWQTLRSHAPQRASSASLSP
jgi:nicotinamide-nucleotide amidase